MYAHKIITYTGGIEHLFDDWHSLQTFLDKTKTKLNGGVVVCNETGGLFGSYELIKEDEIEHIIEGVVHIETDEKAQIGDYVISSEQIDQPRIYKVYHLTDSRLVLGKYSRGHTNLWHYKVLKAKTM